MRIAIGLLVAFVGFAGARSAREYARSTAGDAQAAANQPFVPSPDAAPFVSLGFREAAADLLYVRMIGYFIGETSTGDGVGDLAEAIATLNPAFDRVYEYGANAMTLAKHDVDQAIFLRAIKLLERGMRQFPKDWKLPYLAGQMYTQDLKTDDAAQRRAWDEKGTLLVESAVRKPGAPPNAAMWVASMRTKLGQRERAVSGLREMLLLTKSDAARKRLLASLVTLEERDADALAAEIFSQRYQFERTWKRGRPAVPPTFYLLIGSRISPGFDMTDLATGGRDLFVEDKNETLGPLE